MTCRQEYIAIVLHIFFTISPYTDPSASALKTSPSFQNNFNPPPCTHQQSKTSTQGPAPQQQCASSTAPPSTTANAPKRKPSPAPPSRHPSNSVTRPRSASRETKAGACVNCYIKDYPLLVNENHTNRTAAEQALALGER